MATMTVNETELYYERRGAGEPLLLVQGMTGHSLHWGESLLSALEQDFELVLYDHRGVGRSAPWTTPFTIVDLAADAAGLLDGLKIERAHVFGISMGGMVAQELVLARPELVSTLTLGCTYCGGPGSHFTDNAVVERLATALMSGDPSLRVRVGFEVNVSAAHAAQEGSYERFTEMAAQIPMALPMIFAQVQANMAHDTNARLAEISAPTLVVHGTEDQMLAAANGELIASLIPAARLELLDGVGHLFYWEQPERTAQLICEHVAGSRA